MEGLGTEYGKTVGRSDDFREEKMTNYKRFIGFKCHCKSNNDDMEDFGASSKSISCEIKNFYERRTMERSENVCLSEKGIRCSETCDNKNKVVRRQYGDGRNAEHTVYCLRFRRDFLAEKTIVTDIGYALEDQYGSTIKVIDIEKRTRGWKIWVKGQWMKEKLIQQGLLIKNRLYHMEEVS